MGGSFFSGLSLRLSLTLVLGLMVGVPVSGRAFSYVMGGGEVVHPAGYTGKEKVLNLSVALHPDSAALEENFRFSVTQAINMWNHLRVGPPNLSAAVEIPADFGTDVFGVLIHEMGHTLGLAHPSLGPIPGVTGLDTKHAASDPGPNGEFEFDAGADQIAGTGDDLRGDDENLNFFKIADNHPFTLPESGVIDRTTYSRDVRLLPTGSTFASVSSREVASGGYGLEKTEGMMITGGSLQLGQVRRGLEADDVAGIRYAMSGLDEIQGTDDDYQIRLEYVGVRAEADIIVRFAPGNGFAAAAVGGRRLPGNHRSMASNRMIQYNSNMDRGRKWVFPVPEPVEVQFAPLNDKAIGLTFAAEVGRRYVISWPQEPGSALALIQLNGEMLERPSTGGVHFWIADRAEAEVKFAFPDPCPEQDLFGVSVLRGVVLED